MIICGLGQTGGRLAAALVDHVPVVVIESNPSARQIAGARLRGISVLGGDASDPALLRQAGIERARTLVVTCGTEAVNVDVAAAASRALTSPPRGRTLRVFAHLQIAEQLLLALARLTAAERGDDATTLTVTLTGATAEADLETLLTRYPTLPDYLSLGTRQLAIDSAAFQAGAAMLAADGRSDVTRAYVTLADEAEALSAALALHSSPEAISVPVAVVVADAGAGVAEILGSDRGRLAAINAFGTISETTSRLLLLLLGVNETIARAQHAQWLRAMERSAGAAAAENPNFKPWDRLSDEQKEFNRSLADDINAKLDRIGAIVVPMPLPDGAGDRFAFSDAELELLAREEHERWMAQRLGLGWKYAKQRDDARKLHDALKPYDQLDEASREKDRDAVAEIPATLASAGFAIRRTVAEPPTSDSPRGGSWTGSRG